MVRRISSSRPITGIELAAGRSADQRGCGPFGVIQHGFKQVFRRQLLIEITQGDRLCRLKKTA
jgi:hypothetical protein